MSENSQSGAAANPTEASLTVSADAAPDGDARADSRRGKGPRFQYSLRVLFCVITGLALALGICLWVARASREATRVRMTRESFMCTGWSLEYYEECHRHLPFPVRRETMGKPTKPGMPNGTGRPLYSWRAEVATYRDNWMGGNWDPSSAWNESANKKMADYPWQFCYDALVTWDFPRNYSKNTCMMAITGPGTPLGDGNEPPKSLREMDGDTILVVEVRDSGIHWMTPGDLDIRTMPRTINGADGHGISSRHPGGFHVLFADWRIWFVSQNVPFDELEKFFTVEGARKYDAEEVLGPYVLVRFKP